MALSLKQAKTGPVAKRAVAAKPALRRAVVAQAQAKPQQVGGERRGETPLEEQTRMGRPSRSRSTRARAA